MLYGFCRVNTFFLVSLKRNMAAISSKVQSNRLKLEKSPYLLQHASNPVDWYPWGDEAFSAAKEQNKIIFLSVGYSTCHWCHVMEKESFENEDIAKLMNENFINVKVDREERPDVDKVYMTFVTSLSGGGGWPMSVWLTPDLKPIYGGTYYSPNDRYYGQPGFASILNSISRQWNESQDQFKDSGDKIMDVLRKTTKLNSANESNLPSEAVFAKALSMLSRMYEPEYGGFGSAPKFPQPSNFNLLFAYQAIYPNAPDAQKGVDMALHTLNMMDRGGIHDHISRGFARYSTDKRWHVPHFEKMLYDQAQLVLSYINAFLVSKDPRHVEVVKDIMEYVMRDLSHQKGGFYCAEDADSFPLQTSHEKREGAFCVWTHKEITALLSIPIKEGSDIKLANVFCFHYSVALEGNVDPYQDPHDELKLQNVLICHGSIEETAAEFELPIEECSVILEKCRGILYEERQKRPKPHLDDKMLTAWNGMMLAATARAAAVLNDSAYLQRALETAEFVKKYLWKDAKTLLRAAYKGEGDEISLGSEIQAYSDDYAWLIRGLYHLYHATLNEEWLNWAEELQDRQNDLFWDSEGGGYFLGQKDDKSILLRLKDDQDGAEPSVNSVSSGNLVRLSRLLNRQDYEEKAASIFRLFAERLEKVPVALPEMATSLMLYSNPVSQIILAGDKSSPFLKEMLNAIHSCCLTPNIMILLADRHAVDSLLYTRHESLQHYRPIETEELAYVCKDFTCTLPVRTIPQLKEEIVRNTAAAAKTDNI